ncbi:hypothetical protein PEPS_07940 [Persicobacter psychrovividus]|uniref:Uncharacterized protein n=2 Tax=Persicobacter psychrovividus TaxID=387638 RepID=A0ABM7VC46_9BACT|nr:hypothetical protein PEPS_07940 [Persicobacter psychrovividus]
MKNLSYPLLLLVLLANFACNKSVNENIDSLNQDVFLTESYMSDLNRKEDGLLAMQMTVEEDRRDLYWSAEEYNALNAQITGGLSLVDSLKSSLRSLDASRMDAGLASLTTTIDALNETINEDLNFFKASSVDEILGKYESLYQPVMVIRIVNEYEHRFSQGDFIYENTIYDVDTEDYVREDFFDFDVKMPGVVWEKITSSEDMGDAQVGEIIRLRRFANDLEMYAATLPMKDYVALNEKGNALMEGMYQDEFSEGNWADFVDDLQQWRTYYDRAPNTTVHNYNEIKKAFQAKVTESKFSLQEINALSKVNAVVWNGGKADWINKYGLDYNDEIEVEGSITSYSKGKGDAYIAFYGNKFVEKHEINDYLSVEDLNYHFYYGFTYNINDAKEVVNDFDQSVNDFTTVSSDNLDDYHYSDIRDLIEDNAHVNGDLEFFTLRSENNEFVWKDHKETSEVLACYDLKIDFTNKKVSLVKDMFYFGEWSKEVLIDNQDIDAFEYSSSIRISDEQYIEVQPNYLFIKLSDQERFWLYDPQVLDDTNTDAI